MEERIKAALGDADAVVRRPLPAFGDYAVFVGAGAEAGAEKLRAALGASAARVEVAKGFVNITLSREAVALAISEADAKGERWGRSEVGDGELATTVSVEYSNPNPFKEMHIGHLMSNIVGEALSRLVEARGAKVVRDTFGGDVGPHVAKALWSLQKSGVREPDVREIGAAYAEGAKAYDTDPAAEEEIDALNVRIYDVVAGRVQDPELYSLWQRGREVSMAEFRRLFKILGTKIDLEFFDSDTTEGGLRVVRDGLANGVFEESEGAVIYRGEKRGLHTLVFITSRGTPTYETKDIGLAFLKEERVGAAEDLIVTAAEQVGHFKVVLAALAELAPQLAAKTRHVPHGLLRLASGKMSSREGNVITAEAFIRDIISRASEKNPDPLVAEQVAIGAIKYMVLRQSPGQDIIFDPEKSLSLEGDSGPYLQYALVRAAKILSYSSENAGGGGEPVAPYDIERAILHFPEVVLRAAREHAPNLLLTYLTELAGEWNRFYATEQVLGSPEEAYKMRLTRAFANTMANGLHMLGIPTPEKM